MGMHEAHATVEAAAAVVLSLGGAAIAVRAWLDRRSTAAPRARVTSAARSPGAAVRRAGRYLAAVMSAGAAAIHLAAGPEHVESLGDVGLLFYWAALFQAGLAVALLTNRLAPNVVRIGVLGNLALVVAWAWSRTEGLPFVPGGPEAVGVADGITVLLEMGIAAILAGWAQRLDTWILTLAPPADVRTAATSGLIAVVGVALLATTIAVADASGGHHGADPGHHAAVIEVP